MRLNLVKKTLGALLLSAALVGAALAAEPELAAGTASLQKQCIGYGYKAGTDALAECVMKLDLLQRAEQGSSPQVAAPLQNQPPAPTLAPPVNKIVEPTVATKPMPVATPTPASTPTPAAAAIETTAPVPPAAPTPATTTVQAPAAEKPVEATAPLTSLPSSVALEKAGEVNQGRMARVNSIAVIAIKDPVSRVLTKAEIQRQLIAGALGGVLGQVAANAATGASSSAEEVLLGYQKVITDAKEALTRNTVGSGEAITNVLIDMMQENGYQMTRIVERGVAQSGAMEFYKGQNSKTDAILHIRFIGAIYLEKEDKFLRPYIDAPVVLAGSRYGNTIFKSFYSCPKTSKNDEFAFSDPKQISDNIPRASEGIAACMKEIATDVAATLKRPTPPPAQ